MDFKDILSKAVKGWTGQALPPINDGLDQARRPTLNAGILSGVINKLDPARETLDDYLQSQDHSLDNIKANADIARLNSIQANRSPTEGGIAPEPSVPSVAISQRPQNGSGDVLGASTTRGDDFIFDYDPYMQHMDKPLNIPQPPANIAQILREVFPEDATRSAITAWTESGFNPEGEYQNTTGKLAGTDDRGLFQVNSGDAWDPNQISTFDDLLRRKPGQMERAGARSDADLWDPEINARVARINQEEAGGWWDRWFGLRNKGLLERDFQGLESPY